MAVTYYTVKKGDTLSEIALANYKKYSTYSKWKDYQDYLVKVNDIENPNLIYIGQKLILGGVSDSIQPTTAEPNKVTFKDLEYVMGTTNTVFVTWSFNRPNLDCYRVQWQYYVTLQNGTKKWLAVGVNEVTDRYSTYNVPNEATKVRVRVVPVSKKYNKNGSEFPYWCCEWATSESLNIIDERPLATPNTPTLSIIDDSHQVERLSGVFDTYYYKSLVCTINMSGYANPGNTPYIEIETVVFKRDGSTASIVKRTKLESYEFSTPSVKRKMTQYHDGHPTEGASYQVRCRIMTDYNGDYKYSDWTEYSGVVNMIDPAPSGFKTCRAMSESSVLLEWSSPKTKHKIEYATSITDFDLSDNTTTIDVENVNAWRIDNLEPGKEYFFRLCSTNDGGDSPWSPISSVILGIIPGAPTTWSSTTTAISGESLILYWLHNSEDNSLETSAQLKMFVNGYERDIITIDKPITDEEDEDEVSSYTIDTTSYGEGAKIRWQVRTAGILNESDGSPSYGDWSVTRDVDIYIKPTIWFDMTDVAGDRIEVVKSLPFYVSATAEPSTQTPVSYYVSVISNNTYDTVDDSGNVTTVAQGTSVYSKYFDISDRTLLVEFSANNINLENDVEYTFSIMVAMDSGLTAESSLSFTTSWVDEIYAPNIEISIDEKLYSATIRPYCNFQPYYRVNHNSETGIYTVTDELVVPQESYILKDVKTEDGYDIYMYLNEDGEEVYYCQTSGPVLVEDVKLAIYRREYDGGFTEIASSIENTNNTSIVDPHPALDYARYRVVATSKTTGSVSYRDFAIPIGGKSIIIQWNDFWQSYDGFNEDAFAEPVQTCMFLSLPYNIDVSDSFKTDVDLVKYIGREYPVSYYGTQIDETSTWNTEIPYYDKETLYAIRRLSKWKGNVYVREPSGSGYWANVSVSFKQNHDSLTIPITLNIRRVEGGV